MMNACNCALPSITGSTKCCENCANNVPVALDTEHAKYDSPLQTFLDNACEQIANETDNMVWNAITKAGVDIDRDKLIQALNADKKRYEDAYEAGYDHGYMDRVVLCRDCTNGRRAGKGVECIYCSVWDYMMPEDGYCHMARKEEETL